MLVVYVKIYVVKGKLEIGIYFKIEREEMNITDRIEQN